MIGVSEFFMMSPQEQYIAFDDFKSEVRFIVKSCLWKEFHKKDNAAIDECLSFVFEKLVLDHKKIKDETARTLIYLIAKRYFLKVHRNKNNKCIAIDDLLDDQDIDTVKFLGFSECDNRNELQELKTDVVLRLHELIRSTNDANSLLVVKSIIECVLTQDDYDSHFLSLFLFRRSNLGFKSVYRSLKKLNLKLPLSRPQYFDNIFKMYGKIDSNMVNDGKLITDWERRSIQHFENPQQRFRSTNYDQRYHRSEQKIKSNPVERTRWIQDNLTNKTLERDYYEKFGMSYNTFMEDKRKVKSEKNKVFS